MKLLTDIEKELNQYDFGEKLTIDEIVEKCKDNHIRFVAVNKMVGGKLKYVGFGISDKDCKRVFNLR